MTDQQQFKPDWFSKPGDSVRYLMSRKGVTIEELAARLDGGSAVLREVFEGATVIDHDMATTLSKNLGGTTSFWLRRQEHYDKSVERAVRYTSEYEAEEWLAGVSAPGPKPRGKLTSTRRDDELRRRLVFYSVGNMRAWKTRYGSLSLSTRFRTSPTYSSNPGAVSMWLRQGELEADMVTTRSWNPENLRDRIGSIRKLSKISHPARFIPKLKVLCAEAGVAVVIVRAPRGCRASGASRLVAPDKALILLSFRHRSDDQFWFTFFHEIGHLLLHEGKTFVDDDSRRDVCDIGLGDDGNDYDYEWQANAFASSCLIPPLRESEFERMTPDFESVMRFSVSIDIAPGLTVGQMQHRKLIPYDRLNRLKRRWTWEEIERALP